MFVALMAVVTLHANVVDTLTAVSTGIKTASKKAYMAVNCSGVSGAEYEVYAYGQQDFIQIRISDGKSGIVSTKSAGYVKSVKLVMNQEKTTSAVDVDIFAANSAYASAEDLYGDKANKVGSIHTQTEGLFTFTKNYTYVGIKSQVGSKYIDAIYVEWGEEKIPGGDEEEWTPDIISVDSAITLIGKGDTHTHYVKGVVASSPWQANNKWPGLATCDLRDAEGKTETILQAYNIGNKAAGTWFQSQEEADSILALGDTILVFASALSFYEAKSLNEINGGYYVETLGKSSTIDVTATYKYGVGAIATDSDKEGQYAYEIVLSSVGIEDMDNAVHMFIGSYLEKSIDGSYSLFDDKSYVDNVGPLSGSVKLTFVTTDGTNNTYHIVANYAADGKTYRIDGEYVLPGYTKEFEPYFLENDTYYPAEDGDTLTCLQALRFARSLGGEGIESTIKVSIKGFVAAKPVIKKVGQINFDMKDDLNGKAYAQAFYCYEQDLDSILAGDEVLVTGKVQLYGGKAEISNGNITRISEGPKHYRDLPCVEVPDGYISVERAMEIGNALQAEVGKTVETDEAYTVVGYIAKVSYQMSNDTASWFMSDDKESTFGDLQAYKCHIEFLLAHGDRVMITGKIAKYQKDATTANIEFAKGTAQIINPCTDLEEVFMQAEKLRINKILIDGQLLIQKDNKWYNAQGAVIKK